MPIKFPELPFAVDALGSYMSQSTLETHYGKHHKKYVDNVNEMVAGTPLDNKSLEEIMISSFENEKKLYNNAAQVWNHTFFWNCLTPKSGAPSKEFQQAIAKDFGSFEAFQKEFANQAKTLFGSGWAWLVKDKAGHLKIRSMPNAGNPLIEHGEIPILTCDVWEHAYYLDYKNDRPKYVDNFWAIVNWDFLAANLNK